MLPLKQQGSLTRPLFHSNGFKEHVFGDDNRPSNQTQTSTRIVTTGKGYSLICPISVLGTSTGSTEYQPQLEGLGQQLPLPFNIHYIDHSLFLAPNGSWSHLDYVLNKDSLVEEFLKDFKRWSKLKRFSKQIYFRAFNMVLANLIAVHYSSSQLLLSRSNGKHQNSSNPVGIDNRTISLITDYLADRGFIDLHIGRQNDKDKNAS